MHRCVWSRNLKDEEAIARVGPERQRGKKKTRYEYQQVILALKKYFLYLIFHSYFFHTKISRTGLKSR